MRQKLGQLFIIGLKGKSLGADEKEFIVKNNIGGVILFERNLESAEQIHSLCTSIQQLQKELPEKAPLFVGVDMEGGRVHRLKAPFTQWPALKMLGKVDSTAVSFKFSHAMGSELASVGINLNFAPVLDTLTNANNKVIGDRSLGNDPEHVAKHASALVRGYIKANVIPCGKHFPGHGNTVADSHLELPVDDSTLEQLEGGPLIAFKKAFRARLDLVMTAHIKFPKIDPEWPVTLSKIFLKDILRGRYLGYRNMVITDDLDMKALRDHYSQEMIAVQALKAGNDILLYCNDPSSPGIALDAILEAIDGGDLSGNDITESYNRVQRLKKTYLGNAPETKAGDIARILGHPDHLRLSKAIETGDVPDDLRST